jgi:hypothetical protein
LHNGSCASPAINGVCGSASVTIVSLAPTGSSLCSAGTPSSVSGNGPWTWTCLGSNGGTNSPTCTANLLYAVSIKGLDTLNNSADGQYINLQSTVTFSDGSTRTPTDTYIYENKPNWLTQVASREYRLAPNPSTTPRYVDVQYATHEFGGLEEKSTTRISQLGSPDPTKNGVCGTDTYSCLAGTSVNNYDNGYDRIWQCVGRNTTVECHISHTNGGAIQINGVCGGANNTTVSSAPTGSSLCSAGTPSSVSGNGPWTWTCLGSNGGTNSPTCTANKTDSANKTDVYIYGHLKETTSSNGICVIRAHDANFQPINVTSNLLVKFNTTWRN